MFLYVVFFRTSEEANKDKEFSTSEDALVDDEDALSSIRTIFGDSTLPGRGESARDVSDGDPVYDTRPMVRLSVASLLKKGRSKSSERRSAQKIVTVDD